MRFLGGHQAYLLDTSPEAAAGGDWISKEWRLNKNKHSNEDL